MALMSDTARQVVLLEVTVPWEDQIEDAARKKRAKYRELIDGAEDGSRRGFVGQSLCRAFKLLGNTGLHRKKVIRNTTDDAEKASRWLWIKRGDR